MNKLQIIEQIFGNKFTPCVKCDNFGGVKEYYTAKPKNVKFFWLNSSELKDIIKKGDEFECRIGLDLHRMQFDIFFTQY